MTWIVLFPDSVNRAEDVRLRHFGGWTADHVPASSICDQQAAICIFDHIGGVEVCLVTFQKCTALDRI